MLGLKRPISADAVEPAKKDLIEVWHPDRFEADARLRSKAEEEFKGMQEPRNAIKAHMSLHQATGEAPLNGNLSVLAAGQVFASLVDQQTIHFDSELAPETLADIAR